MKAKLGIISIDLFRFRSSPTDFYDIRYSMGLRLVV